MGKKIRKVENPMQKKIDDRHAKAMCKAIKKDNANMKAQG